MDIRDLPARPSRRRFRQRSEWAHPATLLAAARDKWGRQGAANSWFLLEARHCDDQAEVERALDRVTDVLAEEASRLSKLMER
jgi:hypothetical protein